MAAWGARANAIEFIGSGNRLQLEGESVIHGNVVVKSSGSNNVLTLAGTTNGTFELAQYHDFSSYEKTGSGTWTLTGSNATAASWQVTCGTLIVSSLVTGDVAVSSGATLSGSGIIKGATTIQSGGILSPGNSPGTLTFDGDLAVDTGAVMLMEAGDLVEVNSLLTLLNAWTLKLTNGFRSDGSPILFTYDDLDWSGSSPTFDILGARASPRADRCRSSITALRSC